MSNRAERRAKASTNRKANPKGEVKLQLAERSIRLKLNLTVLAEIEEKYDIESLDDLPISGRAILFLIERMALAAGEEVSQNELRSANLDLTDVMETIHALSGDALSGGASGEGKPAAPTP